MNWLDIVIVVALAIPTFAGFIQGLIKTALSLAGVIIGVVVASNFYEPVSRLLSFIPNEDIANVVAFILILTVIMIIYHLKVLLNF